MVVSIIASTVLFVSLALMIVLIVIDQIKVYKNYEESKHKIYKLDNGYGYMNHQKITIDDVEVNRDIPSKNLYYNAALLYLNEFDYNLNYVFGAIILQWIKDKRITKGKNNELYLSNSQEFYNEFEKRLFINLQNASHDNVLEENELKKWVKNNYYTFFDVLQLLINNEIAILTKNNQIQEIMSTYVMSDEIYNDSVKLLGLKKYLINFSSINEKEIEEVHIWEDYLIYANLFGIADKVNEKLQYHYPSLSEDSGTDIFFNVLGTLIIMLLSNDDN